MNEFLREDQREELLSELRYERSRKYVDCIRVILLLDRGKSAVKIAEHLFLNESTVRNYRFRYKEGGLRGLITDYHMGRSVYLSEEEERKLGLEFRV